MIALRSGVCRQARAPLLVSAALLVALAGSGCGTSDEDQVRDAIVGVQEAFAADDLERACELTTRAAQRHVGWGGHDQPTTCVKDLRKLADYFPVGAIRAGPTPEVVAVEVDGDRATARTRLPEGVESEVPLRKEDGTWKVNALYGDIPAENQVDKFK